MLHVNRLSVRVLFFCLTGWVCISQVKGQDASGNRAISSDAPTLFDAPLPSADIDPASVTVSQAGLIDLDLKDQDIAQVLSLLSLQAQRNIIASPNVSGTISGRVYGADFYEVLDGLLTPYGLAYREKGNFIHVYTIDEIRVQEEARQQLQTHILRLNYLTATEAATLLTPMLSPLGAITGSTEAAAGFEANVSDGGANTFAHSETLIICDTPKAVEEIIAVASELDVRPKQVLIEATILSASLDEDNQFGVDLTILADMAFSEVAGGPANAIAGLLTGTVTGTANAFQTAVGNTSQPGGTKIGILTGDVAAFIRALDEVTDTTILSNPKLLVLNRQRAILQIVDKLGYISTSTTETSSTTTVEFLDVGTTLRVRPFISNDGFIRLELQPEISDGTTSIEADKIIPKTSTQNLITNVMVRNGQTVILGGLFKEQTTVGRRQTPFLGDVPLLGAAFRGQDDQVRRTETIFMITPTVVKDDSLYLAGEKMKDTVKTARLGARQGLLPFSRSKLVASHMRDALKKYETGDYSKALMYINMALRLDPAYVQARQLHEKITGKIQAPMQRSMLAQAIEGLIQEELPIPPSVLDDATGGTSGGIPGGGGGE